MFWRCMGQQSWRKPGSGGILGELGPTLSLVTWPRVTSNRGCVKESQYSFIFLESCHWLHVKKLKGQCSPGLLTPKGAGYIVYENFCFKAHFTHSCGSQVNSLRLSACFSCELFFHVFPSSFSQKKLRRAICKILCPFQVCPWGPIILNFLYITTSSSHTCASQNCNLDFYFIFFLVSVAFDPLWPLIGVI